ncbi:Uncharacterized protein dnm_021410 [Desulfonema magnum]|uniref:Uncharacterized protein n=1 Tax=Desulfonema magnum TaxID=45655 RepID=A0A975BIT3_9BACT|nr:Uncharacterized protein dnm_021410 [Desulfonema magnum]
MEIRTRIGRSVWSGFSMHSDFKRFCAYSLWLLSRYKIRFLFLNYKCLDKSFYIFSIRYGCKKTYVRLLNLEIICYFLFFMFQ